MRVGDWLARSAATTPDGEALVARGERLSYRELEARAASVARRLAGLGVQNGDRVALTLDLTPDWVTLLHALPKLGAVSVPLDPQLPQPELEARIEGVRPKLVVTDPASVGDAKEHDVPLATSNDLDAVHSVIHTSGTSGRPRAVELTYGNHLWSALGSAARIGVDPDDRWLCCLRLHHVGGLAIVLRSAVYGTCAVLERFEAETISGLVTEERVTLVSLVGTTLARLLDAGAPLDRLRIALLGGGPVGPELLERSLAAAVPIAPTYGLTEAASQVTTLPPGEVDSRPGSAGTPILPTQLRIDEAGVICVRGGTVAPAAAGPGGWLQTGDLGRLDDEGHLYVLGRADEVIVTGGENVSPEEVERALLAHPDLVDVGVTTREDAEWQQVVIAVVVPREGSDPKPGEVRDFCRDHLPPHAVPKEVRFARSLPRDPQGKLRRRELQA